MSTALQYKIFEKCLATAFLYGKIFGLWVYRTDEHRNRRIKYDFLRVFYSISYYAFLLGGYLAVGRDFIVSANKKIFASFAFQSIFSLQVNIVLISTVSLYSIQFLQYRKRKIAFEKCKEVINLVKFHQLKVEDIRKYLVLFIFKAVVFDVYTFAAIWFNWRLAGSGGNSFTQIYLAFAFVPILIVRFYTNLFYGGTLILQAIFTQFNENLNNVILQVKLLHRKNVGSIKSDSLGTYSRLSDEMDQLSVLHLKLTLATKAFNSIFSLQVVLSIISSLLTLVLRCFYEYIAVVEVISKRRTVELYRCILLGVSVSMSSFDLYLTCDACESLVNQANKAAMLIHSVELNSSVDIRFQRSVDTFSTQILANKMKLNQCGLFDLNLNTFQSAVSAIVSYVIIVIQFELNSLQN